MPVGGGGNDSHITTTQTNPTIPEAASPLAKALMAIATGLTGSPVNFGSLPGIDAPSRGPLIPEGNFGNMLSKPAFQMGMNRMPFRNMGQMLTSGSYGGSIPTSRLVRPGQNPSSSTPLRQPMPIVKPIGNQNLFNGATTGPIRNIPMPMPKTIM